MNNKLIIIKTPLIFKLIILITLFELSIAAFLYHFLNISYFKTAPYSRIGSIFFVSYFVLKNKMITTDIFTKIKYNRTSENQIVLFWVFITIIAFFFGLIWFNPISYLIVDMLYILFGYFLYSSILFHKEKILSELYNININKYLKQLSIFVLIISIIATLIRIQLPYFFVFFCFCISFYLLKTNQKKYAVLFWSPLFLQIYSANRGLLIIFLILLFLAWSNGRFSKKKLINLFLIMLILLALFIAISDFLFSGLLDLLPHTSSLRVRIYQINEIINGKVDWNSPAFLSIEQRFVEGRIVTSEWLNNPISFLFGKGNGATIDGSLFKDPSVIESAVFGRQNVHNIHLLPFALILRHGLLGLILFVLLINLLVRSFFSLIISKVTLKTFFVMFNFCWILYSISAASMLWTCPLFWISLALSSNEKTTFNK